MGTQHVYRMLRAGILTKKLRALTPHLRSKLTRNFSLNAITDEYHVGRKLHGFVVNEVKNLPELCLAAIRLTHEKTGADYVHLARDDRDNLFGVSFRTTPMDSTGVAHILEHISLCGSNKYPCHDPFFKMMLRSLSTFMNAFTGCSYTTYPFSTQNLTDFKNLMSVYLDAAFHPRLQELDFLQEGWRLDHETVGDPNSPIIFKGVVFNEMKGVYADSDRIFAEAIQNHILPDHTFANDSGGNPHVIPQLTYDQLKQFHKHHYHPSNAKFFTYGDFPLSSHLQLIQEQALSKFTSIKCNTAVPNAKRWTIPKEAFIQCQHDPLVPNPEKQTTISVNYLLGSSIDVEKTFLWAVLGLLLTDGPNAPFYESLITPNIGSGYSPSTGVNSQTKEEIFSIGLKGIHESQVDYVKECIDNTIDDVIKKGFSEERIESILHTFELSLRHQTSHFGLNLLLNSVPRWNYDGNPIKFLEIKEMISNFRAELNNNPLYLQDAVKKYLRDNTHRLTLIMDGEDDFELLRKAQEEANLKDKVSKLTEQDRQRILSDGIALRKSQDEIEEISCLPTLRLSDIEPKITPVNVSRQNIGGEVLLQVSPQPTNGVTYFSCFLGTQDLNAEQKMLLPLLCRVMTRMGTETMDNRELAQEIEMVTGGLSVSPHLRYDNLDIQQFEQGIRLSSYCLPYNVNDMFNLWTEIFNRIQISDTKLLRTLVTDLSSDLAADIVSSGHRYAMTKAASTLSYVGSLKEQMFGLEQVRFMKSVSEVDDLQNIANQLQQLAKSCLTKKHMRVSINCLPEDVQKTTSIVESFLKSVPGSYVDSYFKSQEKTFVGKNSRSHFVLPYPVNYVAKCYTSVPFQHTDYARLKVLSTLMSMKFFLREIREKGGAYGGGATVSAGQFAFYSYRDPKSVETLETFNRGLEWVLNSNVSQSEVDEVKLPIFAEVDKPIPPCDRGSNLFMNEISDDMVQKYRENLFKVSLKDVREAAEKYFKGGVLTGEAILGDKDVTKDDKNWETITDS